MTDTLTIETTFTLLARNLIGLLQSPPASRTPAGPCDTTPLEIACDYDEAVASAFADFWLARRANLLALGADSVTAIPLDRAAIMDALLDDGVWMARHDATARRGSMTLTAADRAREMAL